MNMAESQWSGKQPEADRSNPNTSGTQGSDCYKHLELPQHPEATSAPINQLCNGVDPAVTHQICTCQHLMPISVDLKLRSMDDWVNPKILQLFVHGEHSPPI
jgi:hypothetical protein